MLPHRSGANSIRYGKSGRGWYYLPEVRELTRRYGDSIRVKEGYIVPYNPISFGERIGEIYNHRLALIDREGKGKGEKIFKAMLQCFYGKFCQSVGEAPFLCLPWAGWITSFVRAQMLEVIEGQEEDVVCFHTDAVHSMKPLEKARVSDKLGEWKVNNYPWGVYIASGVYCFLNQEKEIIKQATRGFEFIDFKDAVRQLTERGGILTLERRFFAGHQYSRQLPYKMIDGRIRLTYLREIAEELTFEPMETKSRRYKLKSKLGDYAPTLDWSNDYVDSLIVDFDRGEESKPRRDPDYTRRINTMLDVISARR
jgi:hypothetical protein